MDGTVKEGLRPFQLSPLLVSQALSSSVFIKRTRKSYTTAVLSFSGILNKKKPKTVFINEPMMN